MKDEGFKPPHGPPAKQRREQPSPHFQTATIPESSGPGALSYGLATNNPWRNAATNPAKRPRLPSGSTTPDHEPPPGPPSTRSGKDVEMEDDDYQPPPGPPPGHSAKPAQFKPPSGPPPKRKAESVEPPPYDPWYGGSDERLHPPPSFAAALSINNKSPTANANYDDAKQAHAWCRDNPLWRAPQHEPRILQRMHAGDLRLTMPPNSTNITLYHPSAGRTYIRTSPYVRDTIFLSDIPVYSAQTDSPMVTGRPKTLYFELRITGLGDRYNEHNEVSSGVAIGFVAPPYPAWRLPGWHRGSLAVHGDDGRRYVDNSFGGQDFTAAFRKGDVVGLGMAFAAPVHGDRVGTRCQVFFTRNGRNEGGWELHEERDREVQEGDVTGLEGEHDLLAAVGVFGGAEMEAVFRREEWMFQP